MSFIQNGQKYSSDFLYEAQLSCLLWHIQNTRSTVLYYSAQQTTIILCCEVWPIEVMNR